MVLERKSQRDYRTNPFAVKPKEKSFYHPSQKRKLKPKEEKIALSPNKPQRESDLNSVDQLFLEGTHVFLEKSPNVKESLRLDESWPSSERPSSTSVTDDLTASSRPDFMLESFEDKSLPLTEKFLYERVTQVKNTKAHTENSTDKSLLQRYVDRFRHGMPMSRVERQRLGTADVREFWWLNSHPTPSDSSTPKDDDNARTKQCRPSFTVTKEDEKKNKFLFVTDEDETFEMQEKADRLLELSECSLGSSGPAISTEGLGSSSSDVQSFKHYRFPDTDVAKREKTFTRVIPAWTTGTEDDILYRWRLQRKLDVARQGVPSSQVHKHRDADCKLEEFRQRMSRTTASSVATSQPGYVTVTQRPDRTLQAEVETQTTKTQFVDDKTSERTTTQFYKEPIIIPHSLIASPSLSHQPLARNNIDPDPPPINANLRGSYEPPARNNVDHHPPPITANLRGPYEPPARDNLDPHPPQINGGPRGSYERVAGLNIDPHYHVVCDLLPCPHSPKYAANLRTHQDKDPDLNIYSDSDSDRQGNQYKQYLQAEKPDSERKEKCKDSRGLGMAGRDDEKRREEKTGDGRAESRGKSRLLNAVQFSNQVEINQGSCGNGNERLYNRMENKRMKEDSYNRKDLEGGSYRKDLEGGSYRKDLEGGSYNRKDLEGGSYNRKDLEGGSYNRKGLEVDRGGNETATDTSLMEDFQSQHPFQAVQEKTLESNHRIDQNSSNASGSDRQTDRKEFAAGSGVKDKDVVSRPTSENVRHSAVNKTRLPIVSLTSSPVMKANRLNSAIEQVVQDHLFSRTDLTVVSSMDSWTSLTDSRQHEEPVSQLEMTASTGVETAATSQQKPTLDLDGEQYESDGEFSDDTLLQMLRKQRTVFEEKLRNIDYLISPASLES